MSEVYGYSNPINFPLSKIENFNNWPDLILFSSSLILWDDKTEPYFQDGRPRGATDLYILIKTARMRSTFMREMSDITIGKLNICPQYLYDCILQYKIVCTYLLCLIDTQLLESKIFRHESIQLFSLALGQHIILLKALGHLKRIQVNKG